MPKQKITAAEKKEIEALAASLKEQAAQIQKVSAQLDKTLVVETARASRFP